MRVVYFMDNIKTLSLVWLFGTMIGFLVFVAAARMDAGMIMIGFFLGLIFVICTVEKLNSLVRIPDERFMVQSIYWLGVLAFGIVTFAARTSLGIVMSIVGHSFFVAVVIGAVVWYITGIQIRKKALE